MVAFAVLVLTACGQLDSSAVDQQRQQLSSTVAEASLLADGAAHREFPAPFVSTRADELGEDATRFETSVEDSRVAPPARARAARLREAARLVAAAMDTLRASPGDPAAATRVGTKLRQAQSVLGRA